MVKAEQNKVTVAEYEEIVARALMQVLRPYQEDCLIAVAKIRADGAKRALFVMASGMGKTLTSAAEVRQFFQEGREGRVLFLCNREDLLMQAYDVYREYFGKIKSYGLFTGFRKVKQKTDFVFATYQSLQKNLAKFGEEDFAYIVVDEAHHAQAPTFRKVLDYFKPQFLLGMTATPDRLDGLLITEIFGEIVFRIDVFEGIATEWLAEVDYYIMMNNSRRFVRFIKRWGFKSIDAIDKKFFVPKRDKEIVHLIMKYARKFTKNPRIMVFCRSVEHAERIAELFDNVGVVHSKKTARQNRLTLQDYRDGKLSVIVSVQMLNEGLDVPETDVVVFLRNTVSPTVFFQQLGRGLRITSDKRKVLVLDFVANCKRIAMILSLLAGVQELVLERGLKNGFLVSFMSDNDEAEAPEELPVRIKEHVRRKKPIEINAPKGNFVSEAFKLADIILQPKKLVPFAEPELDEWVEEAAKVLCRSLPEDLPCNFVLMDLLGGREKTYELARKCYDLRQIIEMRQPKPDGSPYPSPVPYVVPGNFAQYQDVFAAFCVGMPDWVNCMRILDIVFGGSEEACKVLDWYLVLRQQLWHDNEEHQAFRQKTAENPRGDKETWRAYWARIDMMLCSAKKLRKT